MSVDQLANDSQTVGELEASLKASNCTACSLCSDRNLIVFSKGKKSRPAIMFVGQNPGAEEDAAGEPFIGPAGKLLDDLIEKAGINHSLCYWTNACKCHSNGDRKPTDDDIRACRPVLLREIKLVDPALVVALGGSGLQALLDKEVKIGQYRGRMRFSEIIGRHVFSTYHPAYVLHTGDQDKARKTEDIIVADLMYARAISLTERISRV